MADQVKNAIKYAHDHHEDFLNDYKEILSIPSISTDPTKKEDIRRAAEWIAAQLRSLGMKNVQVYPTGGHPVVYGESLEAKGAPTLLLYGHYDVQPVDPLNLWKSDPFQPTIQGENLYARGASDMKGQDLVALKAVESLVKTGDLPVNIKWLFEGEEEIGSPHLGEFITAHKDMLKSDYAVNPDSGLIGVDYPTITFALRGLAYFELRVYGPAQDLHSGIFGGAVKNPANALAELIAGMHDEQGCVTLPGFYDKVRKMSAEERAEIDRIPYNEKRYMEQIGVPALFGEAGFTTMEREGVRPTLDVNGMLSGFTGEGSKTIIPAWAMAKISCRLVPDQDPKEVHQQLLRYLEEHAPKSIRWELDELAGGPASISDRGSKVVQAMSKAFETVWGTRPYFKREGGSIPVVAQMQKLLGLESVITGFGLPDDNVHSPNEKQHLPTWTRGIDVYIHFLMNAGK